MPLIINRRGGPRLPNRRIPVIPPFPSPSPDQEGQSKASEAEGSGTATAETGEFEPGPKDVRDVKLILQKAGNLPPEVVDIIVDHAEYWVCNTTIADYRTLQGGHLTIRGGRSGEDKFLIRSEPIGLSHWSPASQELWRRESTPRLLLNETAPTESETGLEFEYPKATLEALAEEPVPDLDRPVRKVVFKIVSRDQGWSGDHANQGTYRGSFTWFDAGLERFDRFIECPKDCPDRQDPKYEERNIPTCAIRPLWPLSVPAAPASDGEANTANETPASVSAPTPVPQQARYHHELHATPDHCIQYNRLAVRTFENHCVEWRASDAIDPQSAAAEELVTAGRGRATGDGKFVKNLKLGDMVTVWGRARFPGWTNCVERVEVKVYWAV